jgi:hypothetical protein
MKAVITGASSEVGQIVMKNFDYDWIPIDRTHGVTLPDQICEFARAIDDATLFFNLASFATIQSDLLALTWNTWNNVKPATPRKIISFGSLVTEIDMQTILEMNNWTYFNRIREKSSYIAEKLLLNKTHLEYKDLHLKGMALDYCLPQSILVKFGNIMFKEIRSHEPYTNAEQLVDVIDYALNAKSYISDFEVRWD